MLWLENEKYGDSSDGAKVVSTDETESPIDSAASGSVGTKSLTATNPSFQAGQIIHIWQTRGSNHGKQELNVIDSYVAGTVTTKYNLQNNYVSSGADKAQVRVVPQLSSFTVNSGKSIQPKAWDGNVGGVSIFLVNGDATIPGTMLADALGFPGAPYNTAFDTGYQGRSYLDDSSQRLTAANQGGGGGGERDDGGSGHDGAGGGGAGHANNGLDGVDRWTADGGTGGSSYGVADLSEINLGSGGGAGGRDDSAGDWGGPGGRGAAVIILIARNITITGAITSDGETPEDPSENGHGDYGGGGGGGSGGSILIEGNNVSVGSGLVTALAGSGVVQAAGDGRNGSVGRIAIYYGTSKSGTTNPAADVTQSDSLAVGYLDDELSISESLAKDIYIPKADSISLAESILLTEGTGLPLSDSMSISESLANKTTLGLSDTQALSESVATENEFYRELSDSITMLDSMGFARTANLSDSISISESGIFRLVEKEGEKSEWRFKIKDPSTGNFIASLTNARKRWLVQRLNQEQEAGFILDVDDSKCTSTILANGVNELHIFYKGTLKWAGQIASIRKIAKGDDVYWEVLAKDWFSLLNKRNAGVESIREFTTTDAGTIAWTLIDETQDLANGDFGITQGTIESSITRSPSYDKKNIAEAIKELSNLGQDGAASYGFDFEITPEKVFNVYYPYKGTIKNGVVFRYPNNCENFESFENSWSIVNHEWGLGRHWTGNTAIVSRDDATSQAIYKRREAIKNYRDMSVLAFLQDMVWQDIQWLKDPEVVVRFESRIDAKTGIDDYNVGDGVVVVCNEFDIDEWLWIYERKIEIGEDDELKVTLTVGN